MEQRGGRHASGGRVRASRCSDGDGRRGVALAEGARRCCGWNVDAVGIGAESGGRVGRVLMGTLEQCTGNLRGGRRRLGRSLRTWEAGSSWTACLDDELGGSSDALDGRDVADVGAGSQTEADSGSRTLYGGKGGGGVVRHDGGRLVRRQLTDRRGSGVVGEGSRRGWRGSRRWSEERRKAARVEVVSLRWRGGWLQ